MGKLIYITIHQFKNKESDGVAKKILSQIKAFRNMGYSVSYTGINYENVFIANESEVREFKLNRFRPNRSSVYKSIMKYLNNNNFKVAYIRGLSCDFEYLKLLKKLENCGTRIIIEIPTYPREKATLKQNGIRGVLLYILDKMLSVDLYKINIDRFLVIGNQVDRLFGKPAYNIYNGVDVEEYGVREYPVKDEVHVAAVAHVNNKHGYDRFIEGMFEYYASVDKLKKRIFLHVIGSGTKNLETLVAKYNLNNYVMFHGVLSGERLDEVLNESQIALGALAIHRDNLWRGSVLKVKEYCARGIPFVVSYEEDKLVGEPFCLQVSPDETSIDINQIINFEDYCCKNSDDLIKKMRNIAEKQFKWETIYKDHF